MDSGRRHLWLMLAATFATGVVDAVGFLGLDRVFTANMTGNVVILGMALTGADDFPVLGPALALAGFMGGAVVGGRALRGPPHYWGVRLTGLFLTAGLLIVACGVVLVLVEESPSSPTTVGLTTVLGMAMGLQASAARHLGVKDVTTVVVTSTITGLSADSRLAGGAGTGWARRLLAVALILAGAAVGAVMLTWHLAAGPFLAGAVVVLVALLGSLGMHRGKVTAGPLPLTPAREQRT